jgi:hypothetical protein
MAFIGGYAAIEPLHHAVDSWGLGPGLGQPVLYAQLLALNRPGLN